MQRTCKLDAVAYFFVQALWLPVVKRALQPFYETYKISRHEFKAIASELMKQPFDTTQDRAYDSLRLRVHVWSRAECICRMQGAGSCVSTPELNCIFSVYTAFLPIKWLLYPGRRF